MTKKGPFFGPHNVRKSRRAKRGLPSKRLIFGFVFAPETDMIFGDGVGASLVRGPYCQHVCLCDADRLLH